MPERQGLTAQAEHLKRLYENSHTITQANDSSYNRNRLRLLYKKR